MDDPRDFFTNPALRTRLSRFQNPWNSMFGQRKRRTSPPSSASGPSAADSHPKVDPYHDDFFQSHFDAPHWNEPRGWPPMNGARMRMQDHPERGAKSNADMFNYIPDEFRQYMPEKFGFPHHPPPPHQRQTSTPTSTHPPQTPPQQAQAQPQQQQYNQRSNSGDLRRPKFCDAGMQTDDVSPSESAANLNEQQEMPPRGNTPQGPRPASEPNVQQQQKQPHQSGYARSFADTGVGNSPNGSFASAQAYASTGDAAGNDQRQARSNSNSMGNVRRVPILVEGQPSSLPKESYMPHRQPPQRQQAPEQAPPKRPPPPTAREVPLERPVEPPSPSVVSINKIQDIQQDVLDLMFKVEQYQGGNKADKDYKYLDEMLTRNLLKLDTIDTRGNDSIRLARKEAIKCIQASLNVLEAKIDGGAKGVKVEGEAEQQESGEADNEKEEAAGGKETKQEDEAVKAPEQSPEEVDKSKIPIPLPGIPGQVPPATIRDCNSDDEDAQPVYVTEKTVELKTNKP